MVMYVPSFFLNDSIENLTDFVIISSNLQAIVDVYPVKKPTKTLFYFYFLNKKNSFSLGYPAEGYFLAQNE